MPAILSVSCFYTKGCRSDMCVSDSASYRIKCIQSYYISSRTSQIKYIIFFSTT